MSALQLFRAWALIALVMIANGALRELLLKRYLGATVAEAISAFLGIIWIVLLTSILLRRLVGRATSELVVASVTLVALSVAFEFLFGHYVEGESWTALADNYAIWRGHLWPAVLLTLAMMPFVWGRWQRT
jgi:hypothetical protein